MQRVRTPNSQRLSTLYKFALGFGYCLCSAFTMRTHTSAIGAPPGRIVIAAIPRE
jgi:hypothetical protein